MFVRKLLICVVAVVVSGLFAFQAARLEGADILIADRLTNSVYRYSPSGIYLGTVLTDNVNLNAPAGIAVSPDHTKLFVSSSGNNQVVEYDYNAATGSASNPVVFADSVDGLYFPNSITFNPAGNRVYISNLGGTGVDQFNLDGTSAGSPLYGVVGGALGTAEDPIYPTAGMAFAPDGKLLVAGFQSYSGTVGAIGKSDDALSYLNNFITPQLTDDPPAVSTLNGAGALLVHGTTLYVPSGFAGTVTAYNTATGAVDNSFSPILGSTDFPASIALMPDGNSILVGFLGPLGSPGGEGYVNQYALNGALIGSWATPSQAGGFTEATAMAVVPEPATLMLCVCGAATLLVARSVGSRARRRSRGPSML